MHKVLLKEQQEQSWEEANNLFSFSVSKVTLELQMSICRQSVCYKNPSASQNCSYRPMSLSTIEPIDYLSAILVEMKLRFREFTNHYNECPAVLMEFSSTAIEIFINNVFVGNNNLLLTFFCTNCFVADISKSHSDSLTSFLLQFCLSISAAAGPRSRLSLTCRNVFICCLFCPLPACCMLCFQ